MMVAVSPTCINSEGARARGELRSKAAARLSRAAAKGARRATQTVTRRVTESSIGGDRGAWRREQHG